MQIKYDQENINALLNYLSQRPYIEVVGLIGMLQAGQPVVKEEIKPDGK